MVVSVLRTSSGKGERSAACAEKGETDEAITPLLRAVAAAVLKSDLTACREGKEDEEEEDGL